MNEKKKILVVDDNKDFCENVKDELEMKNYDVMVAYNGLKGIDMAKRHGVDLIFMDIRMPGMWGVDALKKIKKMAPSTPVIMVTAYGVEDIIRESLHEGAYGALNKPLDFDNEKLTSIIERAMSEKLRVLVVDDDEDFCVSINDILSDGGCSVAIAHDSVAAIQKALENDFDVMLVDMKPPTWNGLGTCRI
ncbi:MAG: response regulator, partial [Thermoplasmata archaeon]|nr:response regulator [Thermoplasmata archaeon]